MALVQATLLLPMGQAQQGRAEEAKQITKALHNRSLWWEGWEERQTGEHLQQGRVRRGMAQLPCFCQLNGMFPFQLFIQKHDA